MSGTEGREIRPCYLHEMVQRWDYGVPVVCVHTFSQEHRARCRFPSVCSHQQGGTTRPPKPHISSRICACIQQHFHACVMARLRCHVEDCDLPSAHSCVNVHTGFQQCCHNSQVVASSCFRKSPPPCGPPRVDRWLELPADRSQPPGGLQRQRPGAVILFPGNIQTVDTCPDTQQPFAHRPLVGGRRSVQRREFDIRPRKEHRPGKIGSVHIDWLDECCIHFSKAPNTPRLLHCS